MRDFLLILTAFLFVFIESAFAFPKIRLEKVAQGFQNPVQVVWPEDGSGRFFVVEQKGVIRVLKKGEKGPGNIYLNIEDRVVSGGELGLLSLAFHPKFKENGRLFVNYTAREEGLVTRVSEFHAVSQGPKADSKSERLLLKFSQPYPNHNGGLILFGPDNHLYIGTGDGGSALDPHNYAQSLNTWLGKILRIDVDAMEGGRPYRIPKDNPFLNQKGARPEIFAYGLRNPWRFSFDRKTGFLYAGDVGQWDREEITVVKKGGNHGWRIMEGNICTPKISPDCSLRNHVPPIIDYGREDGFSVTGGYVYRGLRDPLLNGTYFYGDYGSGNLWGLNFNGQKVQKQEKLFETGLLISSFGEDEEGEIYIVDHRGWIYRIMVSL